MRAPLPVRVRLYESSDADPTLTVFLRAVTETAARDYSPEQIAAWARPDDRDLATWHARRVSRGTIVAEIDGEVVGFSDVDESGYVDMMFVRPDAAGLGVGAALLEEIASRALAQGIGTLRTHASITARPFFERHGFVVVAERHPVVGGVSLTNYLMTRSDAEGEPQVAR